MDLDSTILFPETVCLLPCQPRPSPSLPAFSIPASTNTDSPSRPASFVDIVKNSQSVPIAPSRAPLVSATVADGAVPQQSSNAVIKVIGQYKSVKINQAAYDKRVQLCANALIGRIVLSKGDSPWRIGDLKLQLSKLWGLKENWRLISLGKGYYNIFLESQAARNSVWGGGAINVKPGIFRLQPWTPDFSPIAQKNTTAQVWVRILYLPWEYWDPIILADIAKCLGCLLRIDRTTLDGDFGHYARILVDVDLSSTLLTTLAIERDGGQVWVDFIYENLPAFCKLCSAIGHHPYQCRQNKGPPLRDAEDIRKQRETRRSKSPPPREPAQKTWKPVAPKVSQPTPKRLEDQSGCNNNVVPIKTVFEKIIVGTTIQPAAPQSKNDTILNTTDTTESGSHRPDSQLRRWRDIAARTAEDESPPINALAKDVTLSPFEDSSSLVKEKNPWSSDSEEEPIRGFIPSGYYNSFPATNSWNAPRKVLFDNIIDPLARNGYDVRPLPEDMEKLAEHVVSEEDTDTNNGANSPSWADHAEDHAEKKQNWFTVKNKKKFKIATRSSGSGRRSAS